MTETIDYIGERYPDLVDPDLRELHAVGMRFCQPAINNVPAPAVTEPESESESESEPESEPVAETAAADLPEAAAGAQPPSPTS